MIATKRRRRLRFGLRSLLVAVILTAMLFGWIASVHRGLDREGRRRNEHAQQLATIGGRITGWASPFVRVGGLEIWQKDDYGGALGVHFEATDFADHETAKTLETFMKDNRKIAFLRIRSTKGTDQLLRHLTALERLQLLDVANSDITDGGLQNLKVLTSLRTVSLTNTNVSPEGINALREALPECDVSRK